MGSILLNQYRRAVTAGGEPLDPPFFLPFCFRAARRPPPIPVGRPAPL